MVLSVGRWALAFVIRRIRWFAVVGWYWTMLVVVPAVLWCLDIVKAAIAAAARYYELVRSKATLRSLLESLPMADWPPPGSFFEHIGVALYRNYVLQVGKVQLVFIGLAIAIYALDRWRDLRAFDDFRGVGLFYRFGGETRRSVYPIPLPAGATVEEAARLAREIGGRLYERISGSVPLAGVRVDRDYSIRNSTTRERKTFLRIMAITPRGSSVTHLVHLAPCGATIILHDFGYVRGMISSAERILYFLEAPYRVWFWLWPWVRNRISVTLGLSRIDHDEFELIEVRTLYSMTLEVLTREMVASLKELDLLTEELRQLIVNNFSAAQQVNIGSPHAQSFSVSGSPGSVITQTGSVAGQEVRHGK